MHFIPAYILSFFMKQRIPAAVPHKLWADATDIWEENVFPATKATVFHPYINNPVFASAPLLYTENILPKTKKSKGTQKSNLWRKM